MLSRRSRQMNAFGKQFKMIEAEKLLEVLKNDPLWYKSGPVSDLIDKFIDKPEVEKDKELSSQKREFLRLIALALRHGAILLGNRLEGWNDDDRWAGQFNPKASDQKPDIVIIHHTATNGNASFDHIDALGLLRLYVPLFRKDLFGENQRISSGHFLGGRQIFVGYHDLVWPNGNHLRSLSLDYTGFQAGDYGTNCRSYGVAFVGDFNKAQPTKRALEKGKEIIAGYAPKQIIGHRDVIQDNKSNKPVETDCPTDSFYGPNGWRNQLV